MAEKVLDEILKERYGETDGKPIYKIKDKDEND